MESPERAFSEAEIATRVRGVINASGHTQAAFAAAIDLDPTKLSKSLNGQRSFTSGEIARVCEAAGVDWEWLLYGVERTSPRIAARAQLAGGGEDALQVAIRKAEFYDDAYRTLESLDVDLSVPSLPRISLPSRAIEAGERLAEVALDRINEVGIDPGPDGDVAAAIEEAFGVNVAVVDDLPPGLDGLAWVRDGFRLIMISSLGSPVRQRFTIWHELGHVLAGDAQQLTLDGRVGGGKDLTETRANSFAACAMMPRERMCRHARRGIDERLFVQLVGDIGASPQAVANRLYNLDVIDEETWRRWARMSAKEAALRGGWREDLTRRVATQARTRVPMVLVHQAFQAYTDGQISVRPLAAILDVEPDELLEMLAPDPTPAWSGDEEPGETPVFGP
jgi:Zn-dependent peptidase ImmA (M78 family)/transcriptional regulator with XRE-family HTH domain